MADEMTKPTVPEVIPLAQAVYQRPGGGVGCCAHILIEDGNVGLSNAQFCLATARERNHADCIALCEKLVLMSATQHRKLARRSYDRSQKGPA